MFCRQCGASLTEGSKFCPACGTQIAASATSQSQGMESDLKWLIPIGRSGYAIAAGYLGLLSLLFIPAPLAIVFGILALNDIKKHPEKTGKGRAWLGIVLGGFGSLVLLAMVVAWLCP